MLPNVKGFKKVCPSLYEGYEDTAFGTEILTRIDLCSMQKKPQEIGYYFCEYSTHIATGTATVTPELEISCPGALTNLEQEDSTNTKVTSDSDEADSSTSYMASDVEFTEASNLATKMECSTCDVPEEHETKTCMSAVVSANQEALNQYPDLEKAMLFKHKVEDLSMSNLTTEQETRSKINNEDVVELTSGSVGTSTETLEIGIPRCRDTALQLQVGWSNNRTYSIAVDLEGSGRVPLVLKVAIENSGKKMKCSNNAADLHMPETGLFRNEEVKQENKISSIIEVEPLQESIVLDRTQNLESGSTMASKAFAMTKDLEIQAPSDDKATINLHTECSAVGGTTVEIMRTADKQSVPLEHDISESRTTALAKVHELEYPHKMDAAIDLDMNILIAEVSVGVEIGAFAQLELEDQM